MKIHFVASYVPNSKFKLHRTRKFCRTYGLQYTHCFFRAKTAIISPPFSKFRSFKFNFMHVRDFSIYVWLEKFLAYTRTKNRKKRRTRVRCVLYFPSPAFH